MQLDHYAVAMVLETDQAGMVTDKEEGDKSKDCVRSP